MAKCGTDVKNMKGNKYTEINLKKTKSDAYMNQKERKAKPFLNADRYEQKLKANI